MGLAIPDGFFTRVWCLSRDGWNSWNSWGLAGLLHTAGLGFLTAWPSQGTQPTYMVVGFPQSEHSRRPRGIGKTARTQLQKSHGITSTAIHWSRANYGASSHPREGATQGRECRQASLGTSSCNKKHTG